MPTRWPEMSAEASKLPESRNSKSGKRAEDEMVGLASWYGMPYHGRLTANGERYDMNSMTAAHKTLPFDTQVRVTNLESKKQVTVRVNDRGPFVSGRVIDLSREAAKRLDLIRPGVAPVRLETTSKQKLLPAAHSVQIRNNSREEAKYTVQVGYFTDRVNAVKLYGYLKERYRDVSVEPVNAKGYRIQVGQLESRSDAEKLSEKLRHEKLSPFIRTL
jgi:rare lipoprotein A